MEHPNGDNEQFASYESVENVPIEQEHTETTIPTWKDSSNEVINLLSKDEDEMDDSLFVEPGTQGISNENVVEEGYTEDFNTMNVENGTETGLPTILEEQMRLQKRFADKFREKGGANATHEPDVLPNNDDVPEIVPTKPTVDPALEFQKLKKAYLRKKKNNAISIEEEITFMKLESDESARRRKEEADAAYDRSPTPEANEGLFISESEEQDAFRGYETIEEPKKGRKRARADDDDDDNAPKKRGRAKSNVSGAKGDKRGNRGGSNLPDFDSIIEKNRGKTAAKPKTKKSGPQKPKVNAKNKPMRSMANMDSLMTADVFDDYRRNADRPDQPTFDATRRPDALKQLLASVPIGDKQAGRDDQKLLEKCIKSFTGHQHGSVGPAEDGNWKVKGMRSTLKHYQVLGTGWMRDRENANEKPRGGIVADVMGLGKTVMMIANIINGKTQIKGGRCKTTLVVAAPSILTQWFHEVAKHCYTVKEDKHGIDGVLQYRSGHKPRSNKLMELLLDNDIVLTTYHEVIASYAKIAAPPEIIDVLQRKKYEEDYFEENKGILHRTKFHRVVLDEAQAIKNHNSKTSLACRGLLAKHYWAISGTPIMNSPTDLYSYIDLIREPCAGSYDLFKHNFTKESGPDGNPRLNALLRKVMLRRTHIDRFLGARLLDLPKPSETTVWLCFNDIERKVYKIVETRFIERINMISREKKDRVNKRHIWVMILRLRQLSAHICLIQPTIFDLLEREDYEELDELCQNENEYNSEGPSLLMALRKALASHARSDEDGLLGRNVTEIETRPIDRLDFADYPPNEDGTKPWGGKHGETFRFGPHLKTVRDSRNMQTMNERCVCTGCKQPPKDPHKTSCGHIYCLLCLSDLQQYYARRGHDCASCSECGAQYTWTRRMDNWDGCQPRESSISVVESDDFLTPKKPKKKKDEVEDWIEMAGDVLCSAKTIAVKAQVLEWLKMDPTVKIIIYTQFLPMIKILAKICNTEGWHYCKYTGEMDHKARDNAVELFGKEPKKNILLASLRSGGLGLNLTMASRVINLDPWWNSAVEQQAFCRVFRIGQQKETQMTRFVVKGTIDAAMQDTKARKDIEIDEVMDSHNQGEDLSVEELMRLFGDVGKDDAGNPFIFAKPPGMTDDDRFDE